MKHNQLLGIIVVLVTVAMLCSIATATPNGVTIVAISNSTGAPGAGGFVNTTGGSITVINLNGTTQNVRWKAFVGNVSGVLSLDDALGNSIYDWTLTAISGEVYATRHAAAINWSGVNCAPLNATETENRNLSHTSASDNITTTFNALDNQEMFVGTNRIFENTCRTANLFQNSTDPGTNTDAFEELVLYDRGNSSWDQNQSSFGKIIYGQTLETDERGYDNQSTYDFQIIVPERGDPSWTSSTAYYFYMELN